MSRNPARVRSNSGAPLLDVPDAGEFNGGEEVMLASIDPGG